MTDKEYEEILKQIKYNRQMQRKRLYDQARRANRKVEKSSDEKN